MVTTATFPGYTVTAVHGATWGKAARTREQTNPIDKALELLADSAVAFGGNAVIGLRIVPITDVYGGQVGVSTTLSYLAYGTVVEVARK